MTRRQSPEPKSVDLVHGLLLQGESHKTIAVALDLSVVTVQHIAARLLHESGAPTREKMIAAVWGARVADRDAVIAALRADLAAVDRRRTDRRRTFPTSG